MRKIYAASKNLFTLTAEADRVLCQLVMVLTVILSLDVQNEIQLPLVRSLNSKFLRKRYTADTIIKITRVFP